MSDDPGTGRRRRGVVEVWADVLCPFAHWSLRRLDGVLAEAGVAGDVQVLVRSWPLEWVNQKPWEATLVAEEVEALRRCLGGDIFSGFDPHRFPRSSIVPLAMGATASRVGADVAKGFALRVRDALFEQGLPIDDPGVLAEVGAEFGLSVPAVEEAEEIVRQEWREGRRRGVVGSPHFFVCGASMFCPMLRISHSFENWDIALRPEGVERFLAALDRC